MKRPIKCLDVAISSRGVAYIDILEAENAVCVDSKARGLDMKESFPPYTSAYHIVSSQALQQIV